jgi:hypothetical protein
MLSKNIFVIIFLISFSTSVFCQEISGLHFNEKKVHYNFISDKLLKDTNDNKIGKNSVQKVNIGGLFVAPTLGASFPEGTFGNFSNSGFLYGAKFELAYSRLYPFVFGFVYEYQKNPGDPTFMNNYFLTSFNTDITWLGGSLDLILNKYFKSNFTIPIFSIEIKYASVNRQISPVPLEPIPGVTLEQSLLTYSVGLGFTIYVFDLSGKYTFAQDFSTLTFQGRIHLPIIKF